MILLLLGLASFKLARAQERKPLQLITDLRFPRGSIGDSLLTNVGDLEVGPDGAMYVLQPLDGVLRVFDKYGQFLKTVGRPGAGPGEFRRPLKAGWRADTLWVWDPGLNRISLFTRDGLYLRSITLRQGGQAALLASGEIVQVPLRPAATPSNPSDSFLPLLRISAQWARMDTIADLWDGHSSLKVPVDGAYLIGRQPFDDQSLWVVTSTGTTVAILDRRAARGSGTGHFRLTSLGSSGDTSFSREYSYRPRPLDATTVNEAVAVLLDRMKRSIPAGGPAFHLTETTVRDALYQPQNIPPVAAVVSGRTGVFWLLRERTDSSSSLWEVLDGRGEDIALVSAPTGVNIVRAERDFAWGVLRDENDVSRIVRYKVSGN